jgi:hypothetical protein
VLDENPGEAKVEKLTVLLSFLNVNKVKKKMQRLAK